MTITVNGLSDLAGVWTAYTPTVSSGTGTLTSASAAGRYKQSGKLLFFNVTVTITTNGTGASNIGFTLPNSVLANGVFIGSGRSSASAPLEVVSAAASNSITVLTISSTYPGADGTFLFCTGVVELS